VRVRPCVGSARTLEFVHASAGAPPPRGGCARLGWLGCVYRTRTQISEGPTWNPRAAAMSDM
jgi:hypothetical protein